MDVQTKGSRRVAIGAIGIGGSGIALVVTVLGAIAYCWVPILTLLVSIVIYNNGLSKNPPE